MVSLVCASVARAEDIVNNLSLSPQASGSLTLNGQGRAQSFQTPAGYYVVTNIVLALLDNSLFSSVAVDIYTDNGGQPWQKIQTVTPSMSLGSFSETQYSIATPGTNLLEPNTKYWIVVWHVSGNIGWGTRSGPGTGLGSMPDDDDYTDTSGGFWYGDIPLQYYAMAVQGTTLDYGDAPAIYPVSVAANGARHLAGGPVLGALVDVETNGLFSALADGDDLTGVDDEEGVSFGVLRAGTIGVMTVTVSSAAGRLDAWVDWGRDGTWTGSGDQIVTNLPVAVGTTGIVFGIPGAISGGTNFARVRISTDGGLPSFGFSKDGEVEDYRVFVLPALSTRYVSMTGSHNPPFTSWGSAATSIQAAVDVSIDGDTILVSNGVYQTGGRVLPGATHTNRVVIDRAVTVRSVNGPSVTMIRGTRDLFWSDGIGDSSARCVYLTNGALLAGFTLTNGMTRREGNGLRDASGGGAWCEPGGVISNCIITGCNAASNGGGVVQGRIVNSTFMGNSGNLGGAAWNAVLNNCLLIANLANNGGASYAGTLVNCMIMSNRANFGGGTYQATVNNSALIRNTAFVSGGGAFNGTFVNSTIAGNTASFGGGVFGAIIPSFTNCIVWGNTATSSTSSNYESAVFAYSCAAPLPAGAGNIAADPKFENLHANNVRIRATSPCRNTGLIGSATNFIFDLDGFPRIAGGIVDMGAYEFADTDNDGLPDWWEILYGLNPAISNNAVANADMDALNDLEEYIADTDPTRADSQFIRIISSADALPENFSIAVSNSSAGRTYSVLAATNMMSPQVWVTARPDISGNGGTLLIQVPTTGDTYRAFRAGVRLP